MAVNDPTIVQPATVPNGTSPASADALLQLIAPGIQQQITDKAASVANDVASQLHEQSKAAISQVAGRVEEVAATVAPQVQAAIVGAIPGIRDAVLADVNAISHNIQTDSTTQRHMALLVVFMLGEIAAAIVVAYLVGSPQAKGIVGWALAPGALAGVTAWAATGFKRPTTGTPTP